MSESQLYKKYAKYYDKIYADKDYTGECEFIKWVVNKHKTSGGAKLLDIACGTGTHASILKEEFSITGLDLNDEMLKYAKKKVPGARFVKGDMKQLDLNEKFDVILCMFATIAYNLNYEELENTITRFYEHLEPGGIVFFDLHIHEDYFLSDRTWVNTVVEEDLKLARISQSPQRKPILDLNMVLLVKDKGKLDFNIDHHQIALFDVGKVIDVLKKVGFKTTVYAGFSKKLWEKNEPSPAVFVGAK